MGLVRQPLIFFIQFACVVPQALEHQIKMVKKEVKTARGLVLQDDLKARQKVLKRLGYVDEAGMVSIKVNHCCGIAEEVPQP